MTTATITTPTTTQELLGQVFVRTWGYDQTNINFYLVTKATAKTITLTAIGAHRDENGYLAPAVWNLTGEILPRKKPSFSKHGVWVRINSYSGASLWDGTPQADTQTYGGCGH